MTSRSVFLALASAPQEAILRAALEAHGISVNSLPLGAHLETAAQQAMRDTPPPLFLIDLAVLAQLTVSAAAFCAWARRQDANVDVLLVCCGLHAVDTQARTWAQRLGARDLLPGCELAHRRESLLPALATILSWLQAGTVDETALQRALSDLPPNVDRTTQVAQAWQHVALLREFGLEPGELTALIRGTGGVDIRARTYRINTYDECFVGDALVDWLVATFHLQRAAALRVGGALFALGHLYHVVREQPFQDGHFFYRVRAETPTLSALDLGRVVERMRGGEVPVRDRIFHGVAYPRCFVGAEAATWMRKALALSENEAMTLGERLLELFIMHHVLDEHHFRNGNFFFRFYQDEL